MFNYEELENMPYNDLCDTYKEVYKKPEVWKAFTYKGQVTQYRISNYGKLFNINKNKLVNPVHIGNYYYFTLYSGFGKIQIPMHRAIALTYISIPEKYIDLGYNEDTLVVDHIRDGDEDNHFDNTVFNLQWLTPRENSHKGGKYAIKQHVNRSYKDLSDREIVEIGKYLMRDMIPYTFIAKNYNLSLNTVRAIKEKRILADKTIHFNFNHQDRFNGLSGRNKYPIDLKNDVIRMIKNGSSNDEIYDLIDEKYGYGRKAIKSYIQYQRRELGITLKKHVENDGLYVEKIDALLKEGKSNDEIVEILNMPDDTRADRRLLQYRRQVLGISADRAKYFTNEESDKINELLKTSMSYDEIIDTMGFRNNPNLEKILSTMRSRRCQLKKK